MSKESTLAQYLAEQLRDLNDMAGKAGFTELAYLIEIAELKARDEERLARTPSAR